MDTSRRIILSGSNLLKNYLKEFLLTKLGLLYTPNILILMKGIGKNLSWRTMEQVTGFEPVSSAWQAEILTIILYLHGISSTEAGPVPPKCDLCWRVEPATGIEPATY